MLEQPGSARTALFLQLDRITCKHYHVADCEDSTVELSQSFYFTVAFNVIRNINNFVVHTEKASTSASTNWELLKVLVTIYLSS